MRLDLNSIKNPAAIRIKIIERSTEILPVRKIRNAHIEIIPIHESWAKKSGLLSLLINAEFKDRMAKIKTEIIRLTKN